MAISEQRADAPPTRREAVEANLLRATEEMLSEGRCFTELSVEQIAARAGISRTAFYFYFNDKRQVLMRLVEGVSAQFYEEAGRWWSGTGHDDRGELRKVLIRSLEIYREHAPVLTAVVEAAGYDEEIEAFWRGLMNRFVDATRLYIEAQQQGGHIGSVNALAAAFVAVWGTERAWYQHMAHPTFSDEALIDSLTTSIWSTVHGSPTGG